MFDQNIMTTAQDITKFDQDIMTTAQDITMFDQDIIMPRHNKVSLGFKDDLA